MFQGTGSQGRTSLTRESRRREHKQHKLAAKAGRRHLEGVRRLLAGYHSLRALQTALWWLRATVAVRA